MNQNIANISKNDKRIEMINSSSRIFGIIFSIFLVVQASAQESLVIPLLLPDSTAVRLGGMKEPIDLNEIIDASLIFSDVDDTRLGDYRGNFKALVKDFSLAAASIVDPVALAENILSFMYEKLLVLYDEPQTRIDVMLDTGRYNCVSSAVLYLVLARSVGLQVKGVKTKDHAFCIVTIEDKEYDVETTNIYGFNPGEKREFHDKFGHITGYSYVPPANYNSRQETGEKGILALILQNRSSILNAKKQYREAVETSIDAYFLMQDRGTYDKMVASLMNVATYHNQNADYNKAIDFLDQAIEDLGESIGSILGDSSRQVFAADPKLIGQKGDILHNWIVTLFNEKDLDKAGVLIEEQFSSGELSDQQRRSYMVYIYQVKAREISQGQNYLEALQCIEEGIDLLGGDENLLNSRNVYRHNYESKVHNAMARAFNAGKYEEAKVLIEKALEQIPDSTNLKKDLELIEKVLETK